MLKLYDELMKEVISSIISFFWSIIIVGVDNMEKVPSMISTKDLDYLTDIFNWNYGAFKSVINTESEFTDEALSKCARKVSDLFMNNMDTVLDILGGEDNE